MKGIKQQGGRLVSALAAMLLLGGCSILPTEEEIAVKPLLNEAYLPSYETVKVQRGTVDTSIVKQVTYRPDTVESLTFGEEGVLQDIFVKKGDSVKKGDLLAQLDCTELLDTAASYEKSMSDLALQKKQICEQRDLEVKTYDLKLKHNLSRQQQADQEELSVLKIEYDALQTAKESTLKQYEQRLVVIADEMTILQLRLDEVNEKLHGRQIYAPMDGVVSYIMNVLAGDTLNTNQPLLRIEATENIVFTADEAVFAVGSVYEGEMQNGGFISLVAVEAEEGALLTDSLVPQQEDMGFTNRASAKVTIPGEVHEDTLYIRTAALFENEHGYYVYVVDENGLAESRNVTVGLISGIRAEITDGLEEGEDVVV